MEKAPDKTFIGRIEKGFDVLSDQFSPEGITVAAATVQRFVARATRLYEHGADVVGIAGPIWGGRVTPYSPQRYTSRRWPTWIVMVCFASSIS